AALAIKSTTAAQELARGGRSLRKTPGMSTSIGPAASTISGMAGPKAGKVEAAVSIEFNPSFPLSARDQARGVRHALPGLGYSVRLHGCRVVRNQMLHRRGRHVEDRRRIDAEEDGGNDQRKQRHHFAPVEIENVLQRLLLELAENDALVEVERIAGREDHTRRGD